MSALVKKQHAAAKQILNILLNTNSTDFGNNFVMFCYLTGNVCEEDGNVYPSASRPENVTWDDYLKQLFADYEKELKYSGLLKDEWDILLENQEPILVPAIEPEYTEEEKSAMWYEHEIQNYFRR